MGGDTFEGVEKLTNEEYEEIVPEILERLKDIYVRAESYIPLPEKTVHGDIDYLIILKEGFGPHDIISTLLIDRFIINNNDTINSVYRNKQIDFCIVKNNQQLQNFRFYKSYGGIGAYLGTFLPSKEIKLTAYGLFAIGYQDHIKFEFLITNDIKEILEFYGMSYEVYINGFKLRKQYFEYLRTCRFLDEQKKASIDCQGMAKTQLHSMGKLNRQFIEYLQMVGPRLGEPLAFMKKPRDQTLQYFNKSEEFEEQFNDMLANVKRKKDLQKKFNGGHIIEKYGVSSKKINKYKQVFLSSFSNMDQYYRYIEENDCEEICAYFMKICKVQEDKSAEQENSNSGEEKNGGEVQRKNKKGKKARKQGKKEQNKEERNEPKVKVQE